MTWALVALAAPLAALAILGVLPPLRRSGRPAAWLSVAAISTSLVSSIGALLAFEDLGAPQVREILWAPMTQFPPIRFGVPFALLRFPRMGVQQHRRVILQQIMRLPPWVGMNHHEPPYRFPESILRPPTVDNLSDDNLPLHLPDRLIFLIESLPYSDKIFPRW